ncbi:MAG: histidine phosphatase family protein [Hyphomicrobiaceae bacterium]|nr:histidine phosphatase family protein [Hyphomicrobiaceae bacterium]
MTDTSARRLLILRHAKSSWDSPALKDFDRPLNTRGRKAAPLMGNLIAARGWVPDLALVSTARRTRETYERLSEGWSTPPELRCCEAIYEASLPTLLALLRRKAGTARCVLLVGHNPGMQELALTLSGPRPVDSLGALAAHFPTAALAALNFSIADFADLQPATGTLEAFIKPRELSAGPDE